MRLFPFCDLRSAVYTAAVVALTAVSLAFGQVSSTWVHLTPATKPSAGAGCVMVYAPISKKTIMFGGYDGSQHLNDTGAFDGKNWQQIVPAAAPPPRAAAAAAYDATLKRVI